MSSLDVATGYGLPAAHHHYWYGLRAKLKALTDRAIEEAEHAVIPRPLSPFELLKQQARAICPW